MRQTDLQSFRDVIALWVRTRDLARALDFPEASFQKVQKWKDRNSIPPVFWRRIIDAAAALGHAITADDLVALVEPKTGVGRADDAGDHREARP